MRGCRAILFTAVVLVSLFPAIGCGGREEPATVPERSELVLASTTSTQDSGLFDVLVPAFAEAYPEYTVKVIAVGSGEALALGETGDADVLLVHSPASEMAFMQRGLGVERRAVMHNDFVIVGPAADPANVKEQNDAERAFAAIAAAKVGFFSRGDGSGTYEKEAELWARAEIAPGGSWYRTTGQGMGETLTIADQAGGYTLADRATYLTRADSVALEVLFEGDKALFNQYHVITCKHGVNVQGAVDFTHWVLSEEVQAGLIAAFGVDKFGQPLFVPDAGVAE